MQFTAGVALSLLSAVVSAAVAVYAHRRSAPGARGVAAFGAATAVWAGGNAVQVAATTLDAKLLAVQVQWLGILAVPVAWLAFAAEYTDRGDWVTRRTVGALAVAPVVVYAAVLTNGSHHLIRTDAGLETVGGVVRLTREFGALFWLATAYSWLVSSLGTMLLVDHAIRVGRQYRRQTAVVLAGATVPWVAQVAYFSGATTVEPESFFGVTAVAFGYAIARHDLLDLVPVARDRVFEQLHDGVVVVDGTGRVADANDAAARLLGVDLATGDRVVDVLPAGVLAAMDDDTENPVSVDCGGETRWVDVDVAPVGGRSVGDIVVLRDVTELQQRRTELDRENDRLERVADTISHDLRNPLNVASGYVDLAEETGSSDAFDRIREAHDRMDGIIEGTLRMTRTNIQSPEKTDVSLAQAAEHAWLNVVTDDATLELDCGDVVVRADPDQVESLLENVFRNAVEHGSTSPRSQAHEDAVEHGSTSPDSQTRQDAVEHGGSDITVTVGVCPDGEGFFVADDGPGIPEADREAVFERGYTTTDDGTGLGLAIVADVAAVHGWDVSLSESDDGGLRVDVSGVAVLADAAAEPAGGE